MHGNVLADGERLRVGARNWCATGRARKAGERGCSPASIGMGRNGYGGGSAPGGLARPADFERRLTGFPGQFVYLEVLLLVFSVFAESVFILAAVVVLRLFAVLKFFFLWFLACLDQANRS